MVIEHIAVKEIAKRTAREIGKRSPESWAANVNKSMSMSMKAKAKKTPERLKPKMESYFYDFTVRVPGEKPKYIQYKEIKARNSTEARMKAENKRGELELKYHAKVSYVRHYT